MAFGKTTKTATPEDRLNAAHSAANAALSSFHSAVDGLLNAATELRIVKANSVAEATKHTDIAAQADVAAVQHELVAAKIKDLIGS